MVHVRLAGLAVGLGEVIAGVERAVENAVRLFAAARYRMEIVYSMRVLCEARAGGGLSVG